MSLRFLTLDALKIDRIREDLEVETVPLSASVYLRALRQDDSDIYAQYTKRLDDEFGGQPGMTWFEFLDLVDSIREHGFNTSLGNPILVHNRLVFDGQHRLAALYHVYGPRCELSLFDDEVIAVMPR